MKLFAHLYPATVLTVLCLNVGVTVAQSPAPAASPLKARTAIETGKPWHKLSDAEQAALKPIQTDWATLDAARKQKWLAVAQRYAALPAADQVQIHSRMQAWGQLSPAQRQTARDNYAQALSSPNSKPADGSNKANLNEQWVKYQALPPEKRAALQAAAMPSTTPPLKNKPLATTP